MRLNFLSDLSGCFKNAACFFKSNADALESSIYEFQLTREGLDPALLVNPYGLGEMVVAAKLEVESKCSFDAAAAISKAVRKNLFCKARQGLIASFNTTKGETMDVPLDLSDMFFDTDFYYQAKDFAAEVINVVREQEDKKLARQFLQKTNNILLGTDQPLDIGGLGLEAIKVHKRHFARPENLHPVQIPSKLKGFTELMSKIRIASY